MTEQAKWVIDKVFRGKRDGYFFEAGASHGLLNSNTYHLERDYGWTGLLVEPHPHLFELLSGNRAGAKENVCLSDKACEVEYVVHPNIPGVSGIAGTISKSLKQQFYGTDEYETIVRQALPIWELLAKHNAPRNLEYLSLDIEGGEFTALKDFPFDRFTPQCMTIERGSDDYFRLRDFLKRHGYTLAHVGQSDDYWVHRDAPYQPSLGERLLVSMRAASQRLKRLLRRP